jgi:hypothetical protein
MAGPIILSNRRKALLDSMQGFGDTLDGLNERKRKQQLEGEDRLTASQDRALRNRSLTAAADAGDMQLADLKRRDSARQEAEGLAGDLAGFGQAVPDSAIDTGNALPGMQRMQSPAPAAVSADGLKDRIRASWMNAEARSKGEASAFTAADVKKKRETEALTKDEALFDLGEKKNKAGRDSAKSTQDIAESKARAANLYASAEKDRKAAATGKLPNKEQFDAAGFGRRMEQASNVFDGLSAGGYDRGSKSAGIGAMMPNIMKGKEAQQQDQAERNFINATLRRESGAAISPSEFENAETQYFPRAGDSPEVTKQKRENRLQVMESMRAASGNAWDLVKPMGSKALTVGKYAVEVED